MRVAVVPVALVFCILAAAGCKSGITDRNLVYVTAQETQNLTRSGDTTAIVVVDPRVPWRYRDGHIPGAISMPMALLSQDAWKLDEDQVIIVYGNTWNDDLSLAMSKALIKMAFPGVKTLRGGIDAWERAGFPITSGNDPG
ncbi:MAG: rhodanese-like domain-containing protein [Phycisphaerales bacterium]|jgi:rhodanese-related sulfurtransferase|nr:rhodanese-like domain-containing protein [Phycisphaerales bacterium]